MDEILIWSRQNELMSCVLVDWAVGVQDRVVLFWMFLEMLHLYCLLLVLVIRFRNFLNLMGVDSTFSIFVVNASTAHALLWLSMDSRTLRREISGLFILALHWMGWNGILARSCLEDWYVFINAEFTVSETCKDICFLGHARSRSVVQTIAVWLFFIRSRVQWLMYHQAKPRVLSLLVLGAVMVDCLSIISGVS